MVQLLNSLYLGASTPDDYGKAAGVVELLPFDYYLGAAVPSHGIPTVNVLLSGVSPLTLLNAVSLNYVKAFGKCEQDLTPTPTSPVDIVCNNGAIKARHQSGLPLGYTLLDSVIFNSTQVIDTGFTPNNNSRIESKCYRTGTNCWFYGASPSNPRVTLYHSNDGTSRWGNQSRSSFGFSANIEYTLIQDKNGLNINGVNYPWDTGSAGDFTCDRSLTIGNDNGATGTRYFAGNLYYMKIYDNDVLERDFVPCKNASNIVGLYDRVNGGFYTDTGLVAGNTVSDTVEIYYDGTVETVTTKQAFVNDTDVVDRTGLNSSNGATLSNANRCYVLFPCKAGVTYTAQTDTADLIGGNFIEYRQPSATSANFIKSITATDDGLVDGVYKFHATCDTDGWAGWQCKSNKTTAMANNWQITADISSATCQPLLSVGDYKDVQNITNGAITRNVGIYLLDGTENWQAVGTSYADGSKRYYFNDDGYSKYADTGELCTHFVQSPLANRDAANQTGHFFANQNSFHIRISSSLANDVPALKSWLKGQFDAGTPVMFTYPLATPTTETVTGQTLTITQGTNIVTAEGSVDDLELEISYKGYAELTVEEIEAVNTDESVDVTIS